MNIVQVEEKGLYSVTVTLFVLLAGILTAEHYVTIPPVGGFLLRFEFVDWEKELFRVPEFSNRYWYVILPSMVYALTCIYGFCFELDAESKDELYPEVRTMFGVVVFVSLIVCPIFYWLITVTFAPKPQAVDVVSMFKFGGSITAISVAVTLFLFLFFSRPIVTTVRTVIAGTTLVGVHTLALGISMYPEDIARVCLDSALYTFATFVVLATLFAPILFTLTLIRIFFVRRFWRYL